MTKCKGTLDTRLHDAVITKDLGLVKSLLQEDGGLHALTAQDEHGLTPLHHAVISENIEILQELLSKINPLEAVDSEGKTPIFYTKSEEVFELLLSSADEPTTKALLVASVSENNLDKVKWYVKLNPVNQEYNLLHYANTVEMAQLLVKYGADPRIANADGLTPAKALVSLRPHESIDLLRYLNEVEEYLNNKEIECVDSSESDDDAPQEESKVTVRDLIDKTDDLPVVAIGEAHFHYIITNKALKELQRLQGNARDTIVRMLHSGDFSLVREKGQAGLKWIGTSGGTIRYELKIKNKDLGKLRVHAILLEKSKTLVFYDTSYTATGQIRIMQERMTEGKIATILDSKAVRSIKAALDDDVAIHDGADKEESYVQNTIPSDIAPSSTPPALPTTTSSSSISSTPIILKSLSKPHKSALEAIGAIAKEIYSQDFITISKADAEEIRKYIVNMRKIESSLSVKQVQDLIRVSYAISEHIKGNFLKESIGACIGLLHDPTEHEISTLESELTHLKPFTYLVAKLPKPYNQLTVTASPRPSASIIKPINSKKNPASTNTRPHVTTSSIAPKIIKQSGPQEFLKSHQLQYKGAIASGMIMQAIENRKAIEQALIQNGVIPREGFISEDSYIKFIKSDNFWYFMHFATGLGFHCIFPNIPAQPQSSWIKAIALPAIKTTSLMFSESSPIKYTHPSKKPSFLRIVHICSASGLTEGLVNPLYVVNTLLFGSIQPKFAALYFLDIFVNTWLECYIAYRTNNAIEGLEDFELDNDNELLDYLSYLGGLSAMGHQFHKAYKILRSAGDIYSTSAFYSLSKKILIPIQRGLLIATHSMAIKVLYKDIWHLLFKENLSEIDVLKQSLSYCQRSYALRSDDKKIAFELKKLNVLIGARFEDGAGVEKDLFQALFHFEQAYSIDNDQSIRPFIAKVHRKIAVTYYRGVGVEKDPKKAFDHIKSAYDFSPEERLKGLIDELKTLISAEDICTKVEVALYENNVTSIKTMIANHELDGEVICYDFKLKEIPFRGISKNEAFDILEDYFENQEQQLAASGINNDYIE